MPDLDELLVRELRLEPLDETRRSHAGRVRDDVELDRGARHAADAIACTRAPVSRTRSRGSSSSCKPRLPPLTRIVSCSSADESMCVGSRFRCPSGLVPPLT